MSRSRPGTVVRSYVVTEVEGQWQCTCLPEGSVWVGVSAQDALARGLEGMDQVGTLPGLDELISLVRQFVGVPRSAWARGNRSTGLCDIRSVGWFLAWKRGDGARSTYSSEVIARALGRPNFNIRDAIAWVAAMEGTPELRAVELAWRRTLATRRAERAVSVPLIGRLIAARPAEVLAA